MNDTQQKQLGSTLWAIADKLRGAMNADDFRDYMLSFLFLRYLSDNYEEAVKKSRAATIKRANWRSTLTANIWKLIFASCMKSSCYTAPPFPQRNWG